METPILEPPVEKKSKTGAIIATIAAIVLCGCPGLCLCLAGALTAAGVPWTTTFNGYSNTAPLPIGYGIGMLCVAVIFVAIAVVVPVMMFRKPKAPKEAPPLPGEPLPPAA